MPSNPTMAFSPSSPSSLKGSSSCSSSDSLFGSSSPSPPPPPSTLPLPLPLPLTLLTPPSLSGLYFFPSLLPSDLTSSLVRSIAESELFLAGKRDQVMLFGQSSLPAWMIAALEQVENVLEGKVESEVLRDVFDSKGRGRQVIMNLYKPGQGISPHIDLPHRYDSPILSLSLLSGTSFLLRRPLSPSSETGPEWESHRFWLPEGSVVILDEEARWEWEHGIEATEGDNVEDPEADGGFSWRGRGTRVSLTFRWMKDGADVVGGLDEELMQRE